MLASKLFATIFILTSPGVSLVRVCFALQEISQMEQEMCSCLEFAYALHCMWLHSSMTFVMLYLLQHLKSCFPA